MHIYPQLLQTAFDFHFIHSQFGQRQSQYRAGYCGKILSGRGNGVYVRLQRRLHNKRGGYCIEAENRKIVLTGDTRYDESLLVPVIKNADLLLICINGKLNNMNSNEALRYVQQSTPKTALPMHIGLFAENTADPQPFVTACQAINVKSFTMIPGKEFSI